MQAIKIALLGLGTVGGGAAKIIIDHQDKISQILGRSVEIKRVLVKEIAEVDHPYQEQLGLTTDIADILNDQEIEIVAELMGGVDFSYDCISQALQAGKHVVTANKDLVASRGVELAQLAQDQGLDFYYEAAVAGGIPILRSISTSFASDELTAVQGIVNGTTNYILTKMVEEGASYQDALADAQKLGFAEADPTADVEGLDAARKVVILTKMAYGMTIDMADMDVEGITNVQTVDIQMADQLGYAIKLLGSSYLKDGSVYAEVAPMLVAKHHPLSTVRNEMNAVYTVGQAAGEMMFYGAGAGELPTATVVVSDIMEVVKHINTQSTGQPFANFNQETVWASPDQVKAARFFNFQLLDQPGVFVGLAEIFNQVGVSFDQIFQESAHDNQYSEVVVTTHPMTNQQRNDIVTAINQCDEIKLVSQYSILG
ncbi:homoserine dehydrogenase [Aerococcus urinaehominis]|uniref:Homoserine dehydrogenase n=1 Tax=Aerococcus urinaehominis TaxID=128944 RepID=A0A0X8FLS1_9LACT|nr:homoserine dehydrogenase [Aerococcus urinaehominis]AMB99644.1 homoserine dehydrogenase [Aerococcus urinaehominis]SDL88680.1 homoserine dehydrogenase [Aerococcus urinaehominis]